MKIVLLDRNAVSCIKQKLAGKKLIPDRDRALRLLDKPDNLISPLLSIREGQTGSRENKQQIQDTLREETTAISTFFKKAKTDCNFLIGRIDEFSEIFSNHIEKRWDNYILFLNEIQSILYQPISRNERTKYKDKILSIASTNDVPLTHPVVICALSILYGCSETRHILKVKNNQTEEQKKRSAYNTMNDIIFISRLSMIQAINSEDKTHSQQIKFFTFDI